MRFNNHFAERKTKANALLVFRKTAPVKPLEYMVQILRLDAAPIVLYDNLNYGCRLFPFNQTKFPFSVWSKAFSQYFLLPLSSSHGHKSSEICSSPVSTSSFSSCLARYAEVQFHFSHHIRHIFRGLFKYNGTGIQLRNLQQILYQRFDPVKFFFPTVPQTPEFAAVLPASPAEVRYKYSMPQEEFSADGKYPIWYFLKTVSIFSHFLHLRSEWRPEFTSWNSRYISPSSSHSILVSCYRKCIL